MRIFADVPVKSRVRQLCGRMHQPAKVKSAGEATSTVGLVTELHLVTNRRLWWLAYKKGAWFTWGM